MSSNKIIISPFIIINNIYSIRSNSKIIIITTIDFKYAHYSIGYMTLIFGSGSLIQPKKYDINNISLLFYRLSGIIVNIIYSI